MVDILARATMNNERYNIDSEYDKPFNYSNLAFPSQILASLFNKRRQGYSETITKSR